MATAPERGVVTSWLLGDIRDEIDIIVGDIIAPQDAGWQDDSTTEGAEFHPYCVVTPGTATPKNPSLDDPSQDWDVSYQITVYGVDRNQVEDLADDVRTHLLGVRKVSLPMSTDTWKMTHTRCNSIGGVGYTTVVSPTAYSQTDSYTLSLSRSLT